VTARFWTDRSEYVVLLSGLAGGLAAYLGAALSASSPNVPTGPIIVLVSFALFVLSLLLAPNRGVLAAVLRHLRFQRRVHLRQGLLALAQNQPIYENLTLRLLRRGGMVRADGVPTELGRARAAKALRDEARWQIVRRDQAHEAAAALYDGLRAIETVLTQDQIAEIDRRLGGVKGVAG
jgi:manganese/zinc/iron transport system permease protein